MPHRRRRPRLLLLRDQAYRLSVPPALSKRRLELTPSRASLLLQFERALVLVRTDDLDRLLQLLYLSKSLSPS